MQPIIIYSSWSHASLITSLAAQHLAEWYKDEGFDPIEVVGLTANKFRLRRVMRHAHMDLENPCMVSYFGHGFPQSWVGFEPAAMRFPALRVVTEGVNDGLFADCIVHTIACETAQSLGPSMVEKGAITYFGSTEEMFVAGFEENEQYIDDFVDVFTTIPKTLASGHTTGEAYGAYKLKAGAYIAKYRLHPNWEGVDYYCAHMQKNLNYYEIIGDSSARYMEGD